MTESNMAELRLVVQEAVDEERLGQPQFLRCIARSPSESDLARTLDEWIALGEAWFGASVAKRHRLGQDSGVHLTEMAKWATGQAALVTVSTTILDGAPDIDLMLIGSRGTLYHEA
jgi:hypothetical protein